MEPSKANPKETTTTTKTKDDCYPKESKTSKPAKVDPELLTSHQCRSAIAAEDKGEKAWAAFQKSRSEDSFFKNGDTIRKRGSMAHPTKEILEIFQRSKAHGPAKGQGHIGLAYHQGGSLFSGLIGILDQQIRSIATDLQNFSRPRRNNPAQDSTTDDTQLNTEKHTLKRTLLPKSQLLSTSKIVTRSKIDKVVTTDSHLINENNPSQVDILKPAKQRFSKTGTSTKSIYVLNTDEKHSDKTNTTAVKSATITSKIITESKTDKVATTDTQPTTENNPPQVIAKPAERFFPKTGTSTKTSDAPSRTPI
ncbi:hypothetical protein Pst134EB_024919 [Puccinia striiformis f. sp. tritici]|nr:hypothetical protein Pst134EB_024919 [Puccinia striiformis f. sp. tritici]